MPWQHRDLMNQRMEFALRALETDNFRALCRECEISPRVGYNWRDRLIPVRKLPPLSSAEETDPRIPSSLLASVGNED